MKKHSRYSIKTILSFLMALWMLNFSIDSPDAYIGSSRCSIFQNQEDLSFNDIESIVELVVENFLGHTNAIPEHDEADDHSDIQKIVDYVCFSPVFSLKLETGVEIPLTLAIHLERSYSDHSSDVTPPPPKGLE